MRVIILLALILIVSCGKAPANDIEEVECTPLQYYHWESENRELYINAEFSDPIQYSEVINIDGENVNCAFAFVLEGTEEEGTMRYVANGASTAFECGPYINTAFTYTKSCEALTVCRNSTCEEFR